MVSDNLALADEIGFSSPSSVGRGYVAPAYFPTITSSYQTISHKNTSDLLDFPVDFRLSCVKL